MKEFDDLKFYGIANRQRYLENQSWLCDRLTRTTAAGNPTPIPQDILIKMQLAADEISLLRDAVDFSEVQHLTQEF